MLTTTDLTGLKDAFKVTLDDRNSHGRLDRAVLADGGVYLFECKVQERVASGTALAQLKPKATRTSCESGRAGPCSGRGIQHGGAKSGGIRFRIRPPAGLGAIRSTWSDEDSPSRCTAAPTRTFNPARTRSGGLRCRSRLVVGQSRFFSARARGRDCRFDSEWQRCQPLWLGGRARPYPSRLPPVAVSSKSGFPLGAFGPGSARQARG